MRIGIAALLVAAATAASASALEGAYVVEATGATIGFDPDGAAFGATAEGLAFSDAYVIDGDTITFTTAEDAPDCPGAAGVYTFVETATSARFILVTDPCASRVQTMTGGAWTRLSAVQGSQDADVDGAAEEVDDPAQQDAPGE